MVREVAVEATVMEVKLVQQLTGLEDSGGHILLVVLLMVLLRMLGMVAQEQVGYLVVEMVVGEENPTEEMVAQGAILVVEEQEEGEESPIREMDTLEVVVKVEMGK